MSLFKRGYPLLLQCAKCLNFDFSQIDDSSNQRTQNSLTDIVHHSQEFRKIPLLCAKP